MSRQHTFTNCANSLNDLCHYLEDKYQTLGYRTQTLKIDEPNKNGFIFQVTNESERKFAKYAKSAVGMGCIGQVLMTINGPNLEVQVGQGRWIEKGALATLSLFVLWPLAITSGIGAWKQHKLLDNLYSDVTSFLTADKASHNSRSLVCPNCGTAVTSEMKFCGNCGRQI